MIGRITYHVTATCPVCCEKWYLNFTKELEKVVFGTHTETGQWSELKFQQECWRCGKQFDITEIKLV